MENTLFPKDVILVNKLKYGPKLPSSVQDIPWLDLFFYSKNSHHVVESNKNLWSNKRFSGYSSMLNGDIIVFEYKKNIFFVKRCVGIAGDTLEISNGKIYVNRIYKNFTKTVKNKFRFKVKDNKKLYEKISELKINDKIVKNLTYPGYMDANLMFDDIKILDSLGIIDSLQTEGNLQPLVIPSKGMKIILNNENYEIYKKTIKNHEAVHLEKKESNYFINGEQVFSYIFKQDYYFMMGDNRNDSYDSRFIGFIPKENIVGKVQCVLFSNYQDEFQWERFFKSVE